MRLDGSDSGSGFRIAWLSVQEVGVYSFAYGVQRLGGVGVQCLGFENSCRVQDMFNSGSATKAHPTSHKDVPYSRVEDTEGTEGFCRSAEGFPWDLG